MTQLVKITHKLPNPILPITQKTLAERDALIADALEHKVIGKKNFDRANAVVQAMHSLEKDIEASRTEANKPVLIINRAINKAAKDAVVVLERERKRLAQNIAAYVRAVNAERERAEQENLRKIREQQEAEDRKRQEEEARLQAEQAQATQETDEVEADEPGQLIPPTGPQAGQAPPRPTSAAEQWATGYTPEPAPSPAPLELEVVPERVQSAVSIKRVKKLHIIDRTKIPFQIQNAQLLTVNEGAILRLLKAGINVPGCELVEEEQIATRSA